MDIGYSMHHYLCILSLFTIVTITPGSDELKSIRLDAPKYVRAGEPLTLTCDYDLEISSVYAVKWYHGTEEFYRYLPKESPPQQVFPKDGIYVNVTFSNDRQVVLLNTTRETSGTFKCSVSAEITFKTLDDSQDITVVVVGYESPRLYVDQADYSQGDMAQANCTIDQTWPPINVTWFINGVPVPEIRALTSFKPDSRDPSLTSTISKLNFQLPDNLSLLRLKCTGTLYDVYDMSSEMTMGLKPKRLSMVSTIPNTFINENSKSYAERCHFTNWIHLFFIIFVASYVIKHTQHSL